IIDEPDGGAQNDHDQAATLLRDSLLEALGELSALSAEELIDQRYNRFRQIGSFFSE
ncbi:MAG: acetyl-CoA carboxylase carboxyl transferase subunit alpha, partial [bacterium]|nr:acetyl-CoA carboxylase carboxyl transferase subunit alpha [bacterium]